MRRMHTNTMRFTGQAMNRNIHCAIHYTGHYTIVCIMLDIFVFLAILAQQPTRAIHYATHCASHNAVRSAILPALP